MKELIIHCEDSPKPPTLTWDEAISAVHKGVVLIFGNAQGLPTSVTESAFNLLSPNEQERALKMRKEEQRITLIINHALNRLFLSHFSDEAPPKIKILTESTGKPYTVAPYPSFNLSDSATAFLQGYAPYSLGVDLEFMDPQIEYEPIAGRFFTIREIRHILKSGSPWFFKYWTRKEAFLKATGLGIIDSLQCIEVVTGINILNSRCIQILPQSETGYFSIKSFIVEPFYISVALPHRGMIQGICQLDITMITELFTA